MFWRDWKQNDPKEHRGDVETFRRDRKQKDTEETETRSEVQGGPNSSTDPENGLRGLDCVGRSGIRVAVSGDTDRLRDLEWRFEGRPKD